MTAYESFFPSPLFTEAAQEYRQEKIGRRIKGPDCFNTSNEKDSADPLPIPLRREATLGMPFPLDALGETLGSAAKAIAEKVQCPEGLAGNSILATASLAVQARIDVVIPATGFSRPASLFMLSIAPTGERKSSADYFAARPVRNYERRLIEIYEGELADFRCSKRAFDVTLANAEKKAKGDRYEIESALKAVGEEPRPPLLPHLICDEPSLEGLHKLYERGQPSLGIFSDEGGGFLGGYALQNENRLRTFAGLSQLWDGGIIRRTRAGDGAISLIGKRLAMHLMLQPEASKGLLADPVAADQGLLSRVLICAPPALSGSRFQKLTSLTNDIALSKYERALTDLFDRPLSLQAGTINSLEPMKLTFDDRAATGWLCLADEIERNLAPDGEFAAIRGFANKLAEHIARLAAVLSHIENPEAQQINSETLGRAALLGNFYAGEALRLFEAGYISPELQQAEKLLSWLSLSWPEDKIGLVPIYQRGPNSIRDKTAALKAVTILQDHGWLKKLDGSHIVAGQTVRDAWIIIRKAS